MRRGLVRAMLIACLTLILFHPVEYGSWAAEEKYPSRSIDIFCGYSAGGQTDLATRFLASGLAKYLGVTVVPGNKPGGGEVIAASALVNAKPDGYTMAVLGDASLVTSLLLKRATYTLDDLKIIGQFYNGCDVLVVSADSPWKTIQDLIDYAKKNPGVKYGHHGVGSSPWIRMELFNHNGDLKMVGVPFQGDPGVITALLGGNISLGINSYQAATAQADAGKVRIIFVFDSTGKFLPHLPNMRAVFGPNARDVEPVALHLAVPKKTPANAVQILENALEKVTKDPEFLGNMKKLNLMVRYIPGEICIEKNLPSKAAQIKAILEQAGQIK